MNAYTILLLLVCDTLAFYDTNANCLNVGTVLFTASDVYKNNWNKNHIGLLRARQFFQNIIPPAEMISSLNEDFVDKLLSYFKKSYCVVKREAPDPINDTLLTLALSDVIGGYLKVWALPITKYAFYGGTISSEKALKLHRFYKQIKKYLGTDGATWRDPDPNLLHSVGINVAPRRVSTSRSVLNPCEHLAFFEKSSNGLAIPIPYVNWDDRSCTMFIPLKNESLISLTSPRSSDALFRYYDMAKNCMLTSNTDEQNQFDEKFQTWLSTDVVPHLNDDNLYLAFGSILTLLNHTRHLCDKAIDMCGTNNNTAGKIKVGGLSINFMNKKLMIISVVIFLEIIWCVPALLYLICVKKKKKNFDKNLYVFVDPKSKTDFTVKSKTKICRTEKSKADKCKTEKSEAEKNKKEKSKKESAKTESSSISYVKGSSKIKPDVGTVPKKHRTCVRKLFSRSCKTTQETATDMSAEPVNQTVANACSSKTISYHKSRSLVYGTQSVQLKSSLKKRPESNDIISVSSQEVLSYSPDKLSIGHSESYTTVQELDSTKTVTLINDIGRPTGKRKSVTIEKTQKKEHKDSNRKSKNKHHQLTENQGTLTSMIVMKDECPCTCCLAEDQKMSMHHNRTTDVESLKQASCSKCAKCPRDIEKISKLTRFEMQRESKTTRHTAVKVSCNKKPCFEIKFDRPKRDICLELCGTKQEASVRPSKIPTRSVNTIAQPALVMTKMTQSPYSSLRGRSLIPKLKIQPTDDMVLINRPPKENNSKLNFTL